MLIGKKIRLRAIEEKDLPLIVKWRNQPDIYKYFYEYEPLSLVMQRKWFEQFLDRKDEKMFIIEMIEGESIGTVGLTHIDMRSRKCEWGRWIIGEGTHRGKGYGLEVEILICKYVFEHLNMHKLYLEVLGDNDHVVDIHTKFGFTVEGRLRKHVFKDNEYQDVITMGMLRDEYMERREEYLKKIQ